METLGLLLSNIFPDQLQQLHSLSEDNILEILYLFCISYRCILSWRSPETVLLLRIQKNKTRQSTKERPQEQSGKDLADGQATVLALVQFTVSCDDNVWCTAGSTHLGS
jgi:hypothetical protein